MINDAHKQNFGMLVEAVKNDDVCLVECKDAKSGTLVIAVCAVQTTSKEDEEFQIVPLAKLFDGDPYEELIPPITSDL